MTSHPTLPVSEKAVYILKIQDLHSMLQNNGLWYPIQHSSSKQFKVMWQM